jgi:tryptophan synthase alpha chain
MPNRISQTFAAAKAAAQKLLCPFLTAGYPSVDATPSLLLAAQRGLGGGGRGVIELGIPFSDPVADGPVIQASFTHALSHGSTVDNSLAAVAAARSHGLTIPVLAMVSYSLIFKRGTAAFAKLCLDSGIDGVILPDIPLEEAPPVVDIFQAANLKTSLLIAPTSPPDRRAAIARLCDAFVYYLSVSGITGERKSLPPNIVENLNALRTITQTPICVGFGISTPEHVRQVTAATGGGADGAIVGTALIRQITNHLATPNQIEPAVESFVRTLATGLV